jgi:methyl-accepting chemotaxis protein
MFRRVVGIVMLFIGILGIGLSVWGTLTGRQIVDNIGASLATTLDLTVQALDNVEDTLVLSRTTLGQLHDGLDTVETTLGVLSATVENTRPLLDEVSQVTAHDAPDSIEAVQAAIPNMAEVAGTIDATLTALSALQVERRVLGVPIRFDLGINYNPEVPFDQSINQLGTSLDGLPERMRGLEVHLNVTSSNLGQISQSLSDMGQNLSDINSSVADTEPLMDEYIRLVVETNDMIRQSKLNIQNQVRSFKNIVTILFVWAGLSQIAPLYLGWELLLGRRGGVVISEQVVSEQAGSEPVVSEE